VHLYSATLPFFDKVTDLSVGNFFLSNVGKLPPSSLDSSSSSSDSDFDSDFDSSSDFESLSSSESIF
jgi:hypothetical protein